MKVALLSDGPVRLWHERLRGRLAAAGHELRLRRTTGRAATGLGALLAAERRLYGERAGLWQPTNAGQTDGMGDADLVLEPRFDGVAGEHALVAALLGRCVPRVEMVTHPAAHCLAAGLPAIETPDVLAHALDHVLARTADLVVEAVRNADVGSQPPILSHALVSGVAASPALFGIRTFGAKLRGRLRPAGARLPHWQIATRVAGEPGVALARDWRGPPFASLAHDGQRFQADPFLFAHGGRTWLFYEDFPYATRKGVIAVCELDASGRPGPSRIVLEEPFHLSYPCVLEHDGTIYMLPETSAAGCSRLYRADPFPDRWVQDHVLVDGVEANDATLIEHEGRFWLFATLSGDGGSSWDALALFQAPNLLGPWTPHPGNPVLIDAGAARPAGSMWHEGATLMRIAQDCRGAYGDGLAICRVDRLDGERYAQTIVARLTPPAGSKAAGVHTLSRAAGFEAIDLLP